jgi:hypothetical protein
MVTAHIPTEKGTETIRNGKLPKVIQETLTRIRPESAYFYTERGLRTMRAVFDMAESNDMVAQFEPMMMELGATIDVRPVMTAEDLQGGFAKMG